MEKRDIGQTWRFVGLTGMIHKENEQHSHLSQYSQGVMLKDFCFSTKLVQAPQPFLREDYLREIESTKR